MTISIVWLWWLLAVVIMFVSAWVPAIGRIHLFNLALAFALLAFAWPVLTR